VSDQESGTIEQPEGASEIVASANNESTATGSSAKPESAPSPPPRKPSSAIAWLALLLVIAMAAGTAWIVREGEGREAALAQRVTELEGIAGQEQAGLDGLSDQWKQELDSGLANLKEAQDSESSRFTSSIESVEAQLVEQDKELARFSAADRDSWLLAEAGHLLRLANQRLVMAQDPVSAQALLNSADAVLRELDDASLHSVRAIVASDIAALRAVPRVDVEGIYLRLSALIEQAEKLVIFQLPAQTDRTAPESAGNWQGRLKQGYESALAKLSDYIIIRRRDVPMQALMDPQWEGLVRQNLRMLLEQSQVALLSGNQSLYGASLERAQQWVAQFQESDEVAAKAISTELTQLAGLTISVPQPDISRSRQALDDAIEQRQQAAGGQ
jgi:uroporphyrin-3 C-methyltransferase